MKPLHERLRIFLEAMRQREDLAFSEVRLGRRADEEEQESAVPDDEIMGWDPRVDAVARAFARRARDWRFLYNSDDWEISGSMNIRFDFRPSAFTKPAWVPSLDGAPAVETWMELDVPDPWNGDYAYYALTPGGSAIYCAYEPPFLYADLETYFTTGARRGFVEWWPWLEANGTGDVVLSTEARKRHAALGERSLPPSTPPAEIHRRLTARGTSSEDATEILEWLGQDSVLLLPRK